MDDSVGGVGDNKMINMPKENKIRFINRKTEQAYLKTHLQGDPNSLLFIYGPKSCGKSSLISEVINALDRKKYAINYINLRGVMIYDFSTFLNVFFPQSLRKKIRGVIQGISVNIGFFGLNVNEKNLLQENAFKIMENRLRESNEDGIRPVLIIDEIQLLRSIYLNGERYLIDELFNLFVRLTKETHLAHVICATSDSYFIEELYNNAKLSKTSLFYKIDHLGETETKAWLDEEGLSLAEAEDVWHNLGGSPWEIWQVLESVKNGTSLKESIMLRISNIKGKLIEFFKKELTDIEKIEFMRINQSINKDSCYIVPIQENVTSLLQKAINKDVWFYDCDKQLITANSESIRWAFKELAETIS